MIKNVYWALFGNVFYACCQWGMLILLAKIGSAERVGQYALGLAVVTPLMMLGGLQLRALQITDKPGERSIGHYLSLRLLSMFISILTICFVSILFYKNETSSVIILVGLAKVFESISDVFYGRLQRDEHMNYISISMILRGLAGLFGMLIGMLLTESVVVSCAIIAMLWMMILMFYDVVITRRIMPDEEEISVHFNIKEMIHLAKLGLPLGLVMLVLSFNSALPRFFLEESYGEKDVGYFSALSYLIVAGSTVVNAIGQSAGPRLARLFSSGDVSAFITLTYRLALICGLIGLCSVVVVALYGDVILRIIYSMEYVKFGNHLLLLLASTILIFPSSIFGYALTSAKFFKPQFPMAIIVMLFTLVGCLMWVETYGIYGSIMSLAMSSIAQFIMSISLLMWIVRKNPKEELVIKL